MGIKRKVVSFEDKCVINAKSNFRCAKCGKNLVVTDEDFSVDHVVPLSKGGNYDLRNMVGLCIKCNWAKGDNLVVPRLYYPYLGEDSLIRCEDYFLRNLHIISQYSREVCVLFMQNRL